MKSLGEEEKDLFESYENDEWVPVKDRERELGRYEAVARSSDRKDCRINIRISKRDLRLIQEIAMREGIPYQTLVASVLHKYGTGVLNEVPRPR